jgi:hypothetical protein
VFVDFLFSIFSFPFFRAQGPGRQWRLDPCRDVNFSSAPFS